MIEVVYSPQVVEVLVRLELEQVLTPVALRVKSGKNIYFYLETFFNMKKVILFITYHSKLMTKIHSN